MSQTRKVHPRSSWSGLLVCLLLCVCCAAPRANVQTKAKMDGDPLLGERIAEGVVHGGRLWLRGAIVSPSDASGGLISLDLLSDTRQTHFSDGVIGIEKSAGDFWVLRQRRLSNGLVLIVSRWNNGRFEDLPTIGVSEADGPIALFFRGGAPAVLTMSTVHRYSPERQVWEVIRLTGKLRTGVQVAVATPLTGAAAYVGINIGEWGGGLQRVDLETGTVSNIERRDSQALCAGPLNSDCDPVTGLIPDPVQKECVIATVGLVHLSMSEGRIIRICGERVTLVSQFPVVTKGHPNFKMSEAFFGLEPASDGGFWAVSWRAIYKFRADGTSFQDFPLPKLTRVSGISMSHEIPGIVIMCTDVNWAVSTSGYTPLIVPLENSRSVN